MKKNTEKVVILLTTIQKVDGNSGRERDNRYHLITPEEICPLKSSSNISFSQDLNTLGSHRISRTIKVHQRKLLEGGGYLLHRHARLEKIQKDSQYLLTKETVSH